jgi:hypothetical protein
VSDRRPIAGGRVPERACRVGTIRMVSDKSFVMENRSRKILPLFARPRRVDNINLNITRTRRDDNDA